MMDNLMSGERLAGLRLRLHFTAIALHLLHTLARVYEHNISHAHARPLLCAVVI